MYVDFPSLIFPPDLLGINPGATNSRPRQRLPSFCDRILRGHQHLLSTCLSLRTSPIPPNVDRTQTLQTVRPALGKDCVWITNIMGTDRRNRGAWKGYKFCMVIV